MLKMAACLENEHLEGNPWVKIRVRGPLNV